MSGEPDGGQQLLVGDPQLFLHPLAGKDFHDFHSIMSLAPLGRTRPHAGVAFLTGELRLSEDVAFRSRLWKNINRLELVGKPVPEGGRSDVHPPLALGLPPTLPKSDSA